jgi:tetratricopeptide (TPR) repeat protein
MTAHWSSTFGAIIAAGCLLATGSSAAHAQDEGAPERAPLVVQLAEGETLRFRSIMRTEQLAKFARLTMVTDTVIAKDMTVTGLASTGDGGARVTWRFDRVWGDVVNPIIGATFDSAAPPDEPDLMSTAFAAQGGTEFTVTLDAQGRVTAVEGVDTAVEKKASAESGDAADQARMVLGHLLTAEKIASEIEWLLLATPMPADGVEIGTSWEDEDRVPGTSDSVDLRIVGTRRVDAVDAQSVTVGGELTMTCRTGAGRSGPMTAILTDEIDDRYDADSTVRISRQDGLPLSVSGSLYIAAFAESEDGAEESFRQRSRFGLVRLDENAAAGDDAVAAFGLFAPESPHAQMRQASWHGARGRTFEKDERPAEARREYEAALAISQAALAAGRDDGDWVNVHLGLAKSLAYLDGAEEKWDAARAGWASISDLMTSDRPTRADRLWEHVHALTMQGVVSASGGDAGAANAAFGEAETVARESLDANADDAEMTDLLAWGYERWSTAADELGDHSTALSVGVKALTLRDDMAATTPRSPEDIQTLVNELWTMHSVALRAGDAEQAAAFLDRAQKDVEPLFEHDEWFRSFQADIVARRDAVKVIIAGGDAKDAAQAQTLADMLYTMKRFADATAFWKTALADDAIRGDFENHNLYNAACAAALAHGAADGDDKARFAALTIEWLTPHVAMLKEAAESDDEDRVGWAVTYLEYAREGDADFASMRDTPEFEALFTD